MNEEDILVLPGDHEREMWLLDPGPFIDIAFSQGVSNFVFRARMHEASSRLVDRAAHRREQPAGRTGRNSSL